MPLDTDLSRRLQITHPIISAPMAFAAGGKLAAAVTEAGGLGFIGGGYGDAGWLADVHYLVARAQSSASGSGLGAQAARDFSLLR
jgi:NAD(P)H-dependent flavin oxidoreductase YrpB (nitropropane dioxygenase family)